MPVIEARAVVKTFREGRESVPVLRGVALALEPGEIVTLEGPSGSGKTTLLSILGCILTPTTGQVTVDGEIVDSDEPRKLAAIRRKSIGFVFQQYNLFPALTAQENVEYALNIRGIGGEEARRRAGAAMAKVELTDRAHFLPRDLSGGQKQRVAVARAIAAHPPILLADEPTANLDSRHGHEVVELLHDIARQQQRTIIIVSHDHRIRDVADRVLWLQDGRFEGFDEGDTQQSALLDTAGVLYGASPQTASPQAAESQRRASQPVAEPISAAPAPSSAVKRGGWLPWRRA